MKFNFLFFLIIFSFLILFSGCGSEEHITCPADSTYIKYKFDADSNSCLKKEIEKDKCGNGIPEPKSNGENVCNCPKDITDETLSFENGGCSGQKGEYLKYYCNSKNVCDTEITDKVKKEPAKLLNLKDSNNFVFETQVEYYKPFMLDRHKVKVDFMLKNFLSTENQKVSNINIRKVYIVTSSKEILGQKVLNKNFKAKYDQYSVEIPLNEFTMDSFNQNFNGVFLKILVSYTKKTSDAEGNIIKTEDLTYEPQEVFENILTIIDPNNKDSEIKEDSTWG